MKQEERYIIIKIGKEHYGVKISDVKEIVPDMEITKTPEKQSDIYGIMKCRYGCVSVIDLYKLFHVQPVSLDKIAIILTMDGKLLAFPTEKVDCVVSVPSEKIYGIPPLFHGPSQQYIRNVIASGHNLVPVIDTARLFKK